MAANVLTVLLRRPTGGPTARTTFSRSLLLAGGRFVVPAFYNLLARFTHSPGEIAAKMADWEHSEAVETPSFDEQRN